MQLLQMGLSSPHFILRLRHVKQPVLVLFRSFGFGGGAEAALEAGGVSPAPVDKVGPLSMCILVLPLSQGKWVSWIIPSGRRGVVR